MSCTNLPENELYTIPEWSRRKGICHRLIRRAVREGGLPAYSAGSAWPRIYRSDIERWLRSTRIPPSSTTTGSRAGSRALQRAES